jgi:hypothetical protein
MQLLGLTGLPFCGWSTYVVTRSDG